MMREPAPLSDMLNSVMRRFRSANVDVVSGVFGQWRQVVGDSIADNVTPVRIEDKKLTLEVTDQAWATQLRFLENELLHTLRAHFGDAIDKIDIRMRRSR